MTSVSSIMALILTIVMCVVALAQSSSDPSVNVRTRRAYLAHVTALDIGSVGPSGSKITMEVARTWYVYARDHPNGMVVNIGKTEIEVDMIYGTVSDWVTDNPLSSWTLKPGEGHRFSAEGLFAATGMRIKNKDKEKRAIYYGLRGVSPIGGTEPKSILPVVEFDFGTKDLLLFIVKDTIIEGVLGANEIFGTVVETLFEKLFPDEEVDPWTAVKDKVVELIEERTLIIINAIIDNDMKPIKAKIENIVSMVKQNNKLVHGVIMNLVDDIVGFETKFYFSAKGLRNEVVNLHILPLFTKTINMKLGFYTFIIAYAKELNMTEDEVNLVSIYRLNMIKNAVAHVSRVKREKLNYDYDTMNTNNFYNVLMNTRFEAAVHGEDYFSYWHYVVDPINNPQINDTIVAYSEFFGRESPDLYRQALARFGSEPLTPPIIDVSPKVKRRAALKSMIFQYHWSTRHNAICGIKLVFENKQYLLGIYGSRIETLDLKGHRIDSIQVLGNWDVVDCLRINVTDGRTKDFGHNCYNVRVTYKVPGHYIASVFAARDGNGWNGRIANIAVSYQLNQTVNGDEFELKPKQNSAENTDG